MTRYLTSVPMYRLGLVRQGFFWFRACFDSRPGLSYSTCVTHSWSSVIPSQDQNQCRSSVVQHGMEPSQCSDSEQQINSQQLFYSANRQITLRAKTSINQHAQKKNVNSAAGSAQQISSWFNTTARIYNPLTDLSHATIAAVTTRHIRTHYSSPYRFIHLSIHTST